MTSVDINEATNPLADYAADLTDEPLLITRDGKAVAALMPLDDEDLDSLKLANNPKFLEIIERSRRSLREKGGLTSEEIRRQFENVNQP
jgi:PHD/YefM family antitoxin component YafN of YafNO toxin-antitoxin module